MISPRLERPFPMYGRTTYAAFDVWISDSPDLRCWGSSKLLLGAEHVPFGRQGPFKRKERVGAGLEKKILRGHHASGS